ncbi:HAMP domain-containing protein [Eubacterium sp. MSJ-13]|uniref:methyl-accepting chemotaxis protein n=1 Tax=Eubacterium sp. MSJ-13 TaxID=2841513 RepID=UPI001C103BC9|nr:methyl-accepting chemotaxis protein [Eubacterium sp. MSJ-13]MBU5478868.1 HAMP domain-containing protein [Eubacterium sp. MSJ-13]
MKRKHISAQLTRQILTVVLAIFVVFSIITTIMIGNISLNAKKNNLTLQSQSSSNELETFFGKYTTIVEQMALNPDIQSILTDTKKGDYIKDNSMYNDVFSELKKITDSDSDNIQASWIGDIDNNSLTQSDGYISDDSFEITKREWYKVTETKKSMLTSAYTDASTGKLILSAAAPVYDKAGNNIIGVTGLDISLDHINELFSNYKIGSKGFVILLTQDGTIIYHPTKDYQQKKLSEINASDQILNTIQNGKDSFINYKVGSAKRMGYVQRIGTTSYYVLSCMPSSEYYQNLVLSIVVTVLLLVIGIFAIIISIKKVAGKITRPIISLNDVATELANGNLDVDLNIQVDNEIGELADSVNKTVIRLKEYINYIDEISDVLDQLAIGKLNISLKYDYSGDFAKVKTAMLNISDSLKTMIQEITESSGQVSAGADDLAKAAQNIAEGANIQALSVQHLVSTATSVSQTVRENTADAQEVADSTIKVTEMVKDSTEQINEMMKAMDTITDTSNQVVSIIKSIEDIATQTNLLALNASIEAARAGDAGKGFAVVATEIGSLADESSKAASNTKNLIGISIDEINHGTELAHNVVDSMREVEEAVLKVNKQIGKSAQNYIIEEQSMEDIKANIDEISKSVEDNSAASEETSATSEELAAQAATLEGLIKHFELD